MLLLLSLLTLLGVSTALAKAAAVGQVTEFPVPQGGLGTPLVRGSDGNLYFTTAFPGTIGRITPTGQIAQFNDPTGGFVSQLTLGPDGNVWFLENQGKVGRITPAGQITEFTIPPFKGNRVAGNTITTGPDGNLWFTANTFRARTLSNGFIGRVTTSGVISEFGTQTAVSDPEAITSGSDGNVWVTESNANSIARVTPAGQISEFRVSRGFLGATPSVLGSDGNIWFSTDFPGTIGRITPTGQITQFNDPAGGFIFQLTLGHDSNVWFLENQGKVGRVTPAGQIAEFSLPAFNSLAVGGVNITTGSDGNLWLTANARQTRAILIGLVVRVTTAGAITEFATPTAQSHPGVITSGSDGNLWFLESNVPAIGRINTH